MQEEKIKEFIKDFLCREDILIDDDQFSKTIFLTEIDSLLFIKLILEIEGEFNLEFEPEDLSFEKFSCLNDLVKYVQFNVKGFGGV